MRRGTRIESPRLELVRQRLQRWRRTHNPGSRIPEELWAWAVELASEHGTYKTSQALGLNYESLKKRVQAGGSSTEDGTGRFVEILSPHPGVLPECLVELEDGQGTRMRIEIKGARTEELVSLTRGLWRREG